MYIWKISSFDEKTGLPVWHNYIWRSDLGQGSGLLFAADKLGSISQNAIVFAYKVGSNWQVAWAPWPATVDPTKDSAYTFDNVGTSKLRTLDFTAGLTTVQKHSDRMTLVADNLTASAVVDAYAWVDDAASALHINSFGLSPVQEQKMISPQDYTRFSVELDIVGASTTAASVQQVRGLLVPARFLSRVVRMHTVTLVAMEDQPLASGGRVSSRGSYARTAGWRKIVDTLRERRKTQAEVAVTDEDGRRFNAYLVDVAERTAVRRGDDRPVKLLIVTLLERG